MIKGLTKRLGVYDEEIRLFLWTVLLLFIVRSGGTIMDNYGDAVFLKRFGVEFLPLVNMINAVATVIVMGFVAALMQKIPGPLLLIRMFLFAGFTMALIRALIPFELSLIYPLLMMLKAQYGVLLALLFWNLANDLFNTQQAKRLFPLITAGGVIGQIIGSFGTPWFARTLSLDNLLLAYLVLTIAGAVTVYFMARSFPTLLFGGGKKKKADKQKASMMEEMRRIWPMVKSSTLIKIMVMMTFLPNVVIPILNYQFNYAVNEQFTSEDGLLTFFGYMRGVLNIISLVLLLFVGKLYGRFGVPVALMFHPLNYVLAFASFLFRFDIIVALYARMSTQILRTSINVPATGVVMGLFPQSYRAMIRPFLRGTVVRVGLFLGSTIILLSDALFHPRYLSLVALPFVLVWLSAPFWLKRRYTDILTELVSGDMSDIKSMEADDIQHLFRDPAMRRKLREDFSNSNPEDALWYGQLLRNVDDEELDPLVLKKLDDADSERRIELMALLSTASPGVVATLNQLAIGGIPKEQVTAISTLTRLAPPNLTQRVDFASLMTAPTGQVRAHAAAAMLPADPSRYGQLIQQWIENGDNDIRLAGVTAAGVAGDPVFLEVLERLLAHEHDPKIRAAVLDALHWIDPPEMNNLAEPDLQHPSADVRRAAVAGFRITDKNALRKIIPLLGDAEPLVSQQAKKQIVDAPFQDGMQLIRALSSPRRIVREEIFRILDVLDIKDLDVVRYLRGQAEGAYKYMYEAEAAKKLPDCPAGQLLERHLREQAQLQVENIIRVLATQDDTGRMRIVSRGLLSSDMRQKANSQEALDDLLDKSVARFMIPLVDASPIDQKLAAGAKYFKLAPLSGSNSDFIKHLQTHKNWVTGALALETADQCQIERPVSVNLQDPTKPEDETMEVTTTISERLLLLNRIDIFEGLSVTELSAIAAATEEVDHNRGDRIISQDGTGDTLYLIVNGTVAVVKKREDGTETKLDEMTTGDYFGEMALFEDSERSANIDALEDTRLLFLHKQEFNDMVREYPQIALSICAALSGRIRKLHQRIQG